jgi:hypothetical protein
MMTPLGLRACPALRSTRDDPHRNGHGEPIGLGIGGVALLARDTGVALLCLRGSIASLTVTPPALPHNET